MEKENTFIEQEVEREKNKNYFFSRYSFLDVNLGIKPLNFLKESLVTLVPPGTNYVLDSRTSEMLITRQREDEKSRTRNRDDVSASRDRV